MKISMNFHHCSVPPSFFAKWKATRTGEAAKKLGVTENTLKARLWRARHQLAERLGRRLRKMKDGMSTGMGANDEACSYC